MKYILISIFITVTSRWVLRETYVINRPKPCFSCHAWIWWYKDSYNTAVILVQEGEVGHEIIMLCPKKRHSLSFLYLYEILTDF